MSARKRSAVVAFLCGTSDSSSGSSTKKAHEGTTVYKNDVRKWQNEHEQEHRPLTWLRCELRRDKVHVESLYCAVSRKYERNIFCSLKNSSNSWIKGSTNPKLSNMVDHAQSDVHKAAMSRL